MAALILAALLMAGSTHAATVGMTTTACKMTYTQKDQRTFAVALFKRGKLTRKGLRRNEVLRVCQSSRKAKRNALRLTRALRRGYKLRRLRSAYTPYCAGGRCWAIPPYVVMCESGGNFRARNSSSTAGGAYQILDSTWYAHGGHRYKDSHPAAAAPPSEQHKIAARIWKSGGPSQWACA